MKLLFRFVTGLLVGVIALLGVAPAQAAPSSAVREVVAAIMSIGRRKKTALYLLHARDYLRTSAAQMFSVVQHRSHRSHSSHRSSSGGGSSSGGSSSSPSKKQPTPPPIQPAYSAPAEATPQVSVVSLTVSPIEVTVSEDTAVIIDLRSGGRDRAGVSYAPGAAPAHGLLCTKGNGRVTYTPDPDFSGVDTFAYRAVSGAGSNKAWGSEAVVSIRVTPTNDAPVAQDLVEATVKNQQVTLALRGDDPDGETLVYKVVTRPQHGILKGEMPQLTYVPTKNFVGTDSFIFSVADAAGASASGQVTIQVSKK